jgi:hypothetical protein
MNRNQSPMTSQSHDAQKSRVIAMMVLAGVLAPFVLPIWGAALVMLVALVTFRLLATTELATAPVVVRRDSRR